MKEIPRVTTVKVVRPQVVRLTFKDGTKGSVDLAPLIANGEIFELLRDPSYFRKVRVSRSLGTIVWPNGADLAPEVLYERVRGATKTAST